MLRLVLAALLMICTASYCVSNAQAQATPSLPITFEVSIVAIRQDGTLFGWVEAAGQGSVVSGSARYVKGGRTVTVNAVQYFPGTDTLRLSIDSGSPSSSFPLEAQIETVTAGITGTTGTAEFSSPTGYAERTVGAQAEDHAADAVSVLYPVRLNHAGEHRPLTSGGRDHAEPEGL